MIRAMILLLLVGSAYLGWNYQQQQATLQRYELALQEGGEIDRLMRQTQEDAYRAAQAQKIVERGGSKLDSGDESGVFNKVQTIAQMPNVAFGSIKVSKPNKKENVDGFVDSTYRIEHADSKQFVDRARIANLFYQLEQSHRSLKITSLVVKTATRNPSVSEPPVDEWDVEFDLTIREPEKKD